MNRKQKQVLTITQEEAAEVIQEISKVFRFGLDSLHKNGGSHKEKLESELGDLLCMITLVVDHGLADGDAVIQAMHDKVEKLKLYSDIYK